MPDFFNLTPILAAAQAILLVVLSIVLIVGIFRNFVWAKQVVRGVSEIIIIGIAGLLIGAPQIALEIGQWFASAVGLG